jgi:subtilisin family serine protease
MRRAIAAGAVLLGLFASAPAVAGAADPLRARQWGLDMIRADGARSISTGEGAVVAVVDTGVQADHPDLAGRLLPGKDFVDNDDTPQDGNGHGTHVSGVIAADTGNGIGVESVAPGAKILPIRVLGDDGSGDSANIAKGIDYAVERNADVINLSLGPDITGVVFGSGADFDAAVDRALDKGIVVVAAAGNDGVPVCEQSSGKGRLLCVGSVDRRGDRSFFSSFGDGLGVVAPGGSALPLGADEDILSTVPPSDYAEYAGTSQATPHVAGVAALLVSKGIRGQDAVKRILATARDAGAKGPDAQFGAGIVDASAAVAGLGGVSGGGGSGGGSGGSAAKAKVSVRRTQKIAAVTSSGIAVTCRGATAGTCRAKATRGGKTIAKGSANVVAGKKTTFAVKLTAAGRKAVKGARKVAVKLTATVPGGKPRSVTVTLKK